jgi:hypothetical protein
MCESSPQASRKRDESVTNTISEFAAGVAVSSAAILGLLHHLPALGIRRERLIVSVEQGAPGS